MTAERAPRDWTAADLRTIGYFAKAPSRRPDWLRAPQVEWVCSVSQCDCASRSPPDWLQLDLLNPVLLFDTLAALDQVLPARNCGEFVRYGLKALPVAFDHDYEQVALREHGWDLTALRPAPIPDTFVRLGCDLCSRDSGEALQYSPLSCCSRAVDIPTNRWCLLDDFEVALRLAREWGSADGIGLEPGPYVLLEVWADRLPDPLST